MVLRILTLLVLTFTLTETPAVANSKAPSVMDAKRGVISILTRVHKAAYSDMDTSFGTGFIVNREKGLILTNRHIVKAGAEASYDITFFNGREAEAQLLYYDPWQDFALLAVDPKLIPSEAKALPLKPGSLEIDQPVFIVGMNAGMCFSYQTGVISSLNESSGYLPNQSLRISLNTRGGASGSPVFDNKGSVIALIHSSDQDSYSFALPIFYVTDALNALLKGSLPPRKHGGFLASYYPLDKAAKYYDYPKAKIDDYTKQFPASLGRALSVSTIFHDGPAAGKLEIGDIIVAINGYKVGPSLYQLDKRMNEALSNGVQLTVMRKGHPLTIELGLYDLQKTKVQRMVIFGGAIFYEADEIIRVITGAPKGSVFISNILLGSSFDGVFPYFGRANSGKLYFINVSSLDGQKITCLDDVKRLIPSLLKKKRFQLHYRNYGYSLGYDQTAYFRREEAPAQIDLKESDGLPQELLYNPSLLKWEVHMAPQSQALGSKIISPVDNLPAKEPAQAQISDK